MKGCLKGMSIQEKTFMGLNYSITSSSSSLLTKLRNISIILRINSTPTIKTKNKIISLKKEGIYEIFVVILSIEKKLGFRIKIVSIVKGNTFANSIDKPSS